MTIKEVEIATKLNTFLDEARRANSLSEEQFAGLSSVKKKVSIAERFEKPSLKLHHSYFGQDWDQKIEQIRDRSPFKLLSSYRVRSYLIKAGDDLRQ